MVSSASEELAQVIYLDNQATTRTDPRVVDAMLPFFGERFGNPHSVDHAYGNDAETAVEAARADVAALIGAEAREIVFTSGATESNNLAIKGAARFRKAERPHVVTLATEHKCVLESVARLEREGHEVTVLGVDRDGLVDMAALDQVVTERTAVVSIMAANNEIGVIQPLAEIGALCRARGAYFHSDAAQALGKIPLDVNVMQIDLLSISGHKLYGPKGIGALYVRRRPRVRLEPMMDGGGQERGLRSGTLAPALCVGLGMACRFAAEDMAEEARRIAALRDRLVARLGEGAGPLTINGAMDHRLDGNLNVAFDGVPAHALIEALPELALSTGSACTSASVEPSYVLRALGVADDAAAQGLRISIGRFNTAEEIDEAGCLLVSAVTRLRQAQSAAAQ